MTSLSMGRKTQPTNQYIKHFVINIRILTLEESIFKEREIMKKYKIDFP